MTYKTSMQNNENLYINQKEQLKFSLLVQGAISLNINILLKHLHPWFCARTEVFPVLAGGVGLCACPVAL